MSDRRLEVWDGDCLELMRQRLPDASIDSICCDPPYGLSREPDIAEVLRHWLAGDDYVHRGGGFMGKSWDSFVPGPVYWREAFRVLKPGGYLVAFGGTRTYDLLVIAVRLAGFEVRDQLQWLYGSGFPKSLNVGKAIDKAAGAEREVVGQRTDGRYAYEFSEASSSSGGIMGEGAVQESRGVVTAPATSEAERWEGWGTALKPAHEPVVLARKPLAAGTVAGNVLAFGTGALNVDACRIGTSKDVPASANGTTGANGIYGDGWAKMEERSGMDPTIGRWPANVVLDEGAAEALDAQTGKMRDGVAVNRNRGDERPMSVEGVPRRIGSREDVTYGGSGGASRFFYTAKASSAERNAGLSGFEAEFAPTMGNGIGGKEHDPDTATPKRNLHSTVKPIAVMRWLARLVTPPGGLILDPFAGSGSTGCAAALEGFEFIGMERGDPPGDPRYGMIARARIAWWAAHPDGMELIERLTWERKREAVEAAGQDSLF